MDNIDDAKKLLEEAEKTDSSYAKVGDGSNSLVISFGHIAHGGFASKTSLLKLKYIENKSIDMLYLRDVKKEWYLGSLMEIGNEIKDTINFLQDQIKTYKYVHCIGSSMGGYASILFGSILNAENVVATMPQTDLLYLNDNAEINSLDSIRKKNIEVWQQYQNLDNHINKTTNYIVLFPRKYNKEHEKVLHGELHYDNVKHHKNIVRKYNSDFNTEVANLFALN